MTDIHFCSIHFSFRYAWPNTDFNLTVQLKNKSSEVQSKFQYQDNRQNKLRIPLSAENKNQTKIKKK